MPGVASDPNIQVRASATRATPLALGRSRTTSSVPGCFGWIGNCLVPLPSSKFVAVPILLPKGAAGGIKGAGAATLHADSVRHTHSPGVEVMPGAKGCAELLLVAPRGTLSAGARCGWCATAHAVSNGRSICPRPPLGGGVLRGWPRGGWAPIVYPWELDLCALDLPSRRVASGGGVPGARA